MSLTKNDAAADSNQHQSHLASTDIGVVSNNCISNLLLRICCQKPANRGRDDGEWMEPIVPLSNSPATVSDTSSTKDKPNDPTASLSPPTPQKLQQGHNIDLLRGGKLPLPMNNRESREQSSPLGAMKQASASKGWGKLKSNINVKSTAEHWATKEAGVKWDDVVQTMGASGEIDIDELDSSLHDEEVYKSVNAAAEQGFNHASHLNMGDGFMDSQIDLSDYQ